MKQGLSLRVSQHLALTPQLQQSIRLLQLSTLELSQEVGQMLDENPFLERDQDDLPREEFGVLHSDTPIHDDDLAYERASSAPMDRSTETRSADASESDDGLYSAQAEPSWDGDGSSEVMADDSEWGGDAAARKNNIESDDGVNAGDLARNQESMSAHLERQALSLSLSPVDRAALSFLIGSLNDDGYLEDSLAELAQGLAGPDAEQTEELVQRFEVALKLLQSLEPVGVGARDLGECLRLQLHALPCATEDAAKARDSALRICAQPMDLLARRDIRRLVQRCGETDAAIRHGIALIGRLEPKPGRRFVDVERHVVLPDVLVTRVPGAGQPRFRVQLNSDVMPRLRVHDIYANALKQHRGGGTDAANHAALMQRLQEARWFIKNIQQRFDTILRVSNAIVERQKNFFVHGELAMRPLVLREIADELGLHESTISRVTTAKYMATPYGTFELKYFFGSGLGTETGGNASSTAVRALIKQFVAAENSYKPLSDSQMSDMLKEQGIDCARRTVAKYREALKIAPTNLRRALQ